MEIPQIQIHDAKQKLDQKESVFVDIRDPRRTAKRIFPARSICTTAMSRSSSKTPTKKKTSWSTATTATAVWARRLFLIENGFKNVASMSGGFEGWRQVYESEAEG